MSNITHEGEVLLKEKFGSTSKKRLYVNPPDQTNVVLVNVADKNDVYSWLATIFLPQGFPDSVSKDYLTYQIWDTAQAFCSTITGILATQEVLRGVGVGDKDATPLAATITWVLKDGCGHVGRILFAFTHGSYLDAYSKKWRIYADILNNAAMCIEIALPIFKSFGLFALCISTVMKAVVGVAGGATRVAMTQHHAIRGNIADVSAKDSAQETAVNLIASLTALIVLTSFGNSLFIFMCLMILHVMFNYLAVRAVCLRTLNEPRFLLAIDRYLRHEIIATPCQINKIEPIVFYQLGPCILDMKLCGFKIELGHSLSGICKHGFKAEYMKCINSIYRDRNYLLIPLIEKRQMHVLIREEATTDDILCAYLHVVLLAIITCAINEEPLPVYKNQDPRPFAQVCRTLQSVEWSREEARIPTSKFAYNPSEDLLRYLDKLVQKEWPRISTGLQQTGWDLSKHHLITEQWRVSSTITAAKLISTEKLLSTQEIEEDIICEYPFAFGEGIIPGVRKSLEYDLIIEPSQSSQTSDLMEVEPLELQKIMGHAPMKCSNMARRTEQDQSSQTLELGDQELKQISQTHTTTDEVQNKSSQTSKSIDQDKNQILHLSASQDQNQSQSTQTPNILSGAPKVTIQNQDPYKL